MRGKRRPRPAAFSVVAAVLAWNATPASGQQSPPPQPPQPDRTTVVERKPDAPRPEPEQKEPVEEKGPAHVPPDASGIDLTTLETKNLDLLYFDPVQTYLTPYIARSFENALAFHERMF